jgi:hypothetical protein
MICLKTTAICYTNSLPLSATSHMFVSHDVPLLLANIIEKKPWITEGPSGKTLKFEGE